MRTSTFEAASLDPAGIADAVVDYRLRDTIFKQGQTCEHVMYIRRGGVKLSVLSRAGREAVVAVLGPGDFFGEGCLAGQRIRKGSATAIASTTLLLVRKSRMMRLLHSDRAISDRFISHMLARNSRIELDLIDQLVDSSEERLARALLLRARCDGLDAPASALPRVSATALGEAVGLTRARVSVLLARFRQRGFIEYDGGRSLKVNRTLLTVLLHN